MKKFLIALLFAGISFYGHAQDTIYFNSQGKKQYTEYNYSTYEVVFRDSADTSRAFVKLYDHSNHLTSEHHYSNYSKGKLDGESRYYYANDKLHWKVDFKSGKYDGKLMSYYPDGTLKREDNFEENNLISGKCYGVNGSDTTYYKFEQVPQYPGGEDKLFSYLKNEVVYPKKARRNNIQGRVYITFIVDKDGSVTDARVIRGVDPLLDAEALRAVQAMPNWTPGYQDGVPVKVQYNLPVNFTLR